ncbi:MAG TPA: hypothetical protein VNL71_16490 [Chloroflexota bacterium]|nr:hypothetical protein [Chloroflexota bacterium]
MGSLPTDGVRVSRVRTETEVEEVVRTFERLALSHDWAPDGQLRAYPDLSVYWAVRVDGRLAGGLQLVLGNTEGRLPVRTVWPELDLAGRADVADVALLAFCREHRGTAGLFWLVCAELWRYCAFHGIGELWFEIPPAILRLYRRIGWPLKVAGELREHWGELCYPCRLDVKELTDAMVGRMAAPGLLGQLLHQALRDPIPERFQYLRPLRDRR